MSLRPRRASCTACGKNNQVHNSVDASTYRCNQCGPTTTIVVPVDDPRWRLHAACATPQGWVTFVNAGDEFDPRDTEDPPDVADARELCGRCSARDACLMSAILTEQGSKATDRWGIRGGLDPEQRYDLHKNGRVSA